MKSKILINVDKLEYLNDYRKAGISAFLFALKDYTVGYPNTFSIEEINKINVSNKYLLLNRLLDCHDVDNLKKELLKITNIKGIVYEDIAVYQIVKELHLPVELIYFQNHFGTNSKSINFWLKKVDSMFISNELTLSEITEILQKSAKPLIVHIFGYNQIMYSRRLLLSNWSSEFNIPYKNTNIIEEQSTKIKFRVIENQYGTVLYNEKIFNGLELIKLPNIKYGYFNTVDIPHNKVMAVLKNLNSTEEDHGFLNKPTIYKLKEKRD